MKRTVLNGFISLLLLSLVGCGFQLRGTAQLPDSIKTIRIDGISNNRSIGLKLKRALIGNGIVIVDSNDAAVLKVVKYDFERRVLSVGSNAKVSEYELFSELEFIVLDAQGDVLSEQQSVSAQRDYQFDEDEVLGRESEEQLLREQLDQQLIQSILRRLSAIK